MREVSVIPYTLNFAVPAGTSRGVYQTRKSWFIVLKGSRGIGIGECAPLPNLSCDDVPNYEEILEHYCRRIEAGERINFEELRDYPSILFGLEVALRDYNSDGHVLWNTSFSRGEAGITINGLIWMGTHEYMLKQIDTKIEQGFKCLKLKVGAIDFKQELDLVKHIRLKYPKEVLEIRLDANGGFSVNDALKRLEELAKYDIHSIEQPVKARQVAEMASIVGRSPIPIALDEELIGISSMCSKRELLEEINPNYIILKPSLHGGLMGCKEWIELAQHRGVGWWITSALESNVGLNAIAQWCASLEVTMAQGLGTGALFTNNIVSPLYTDGQSLNYDAAACWDLNGIVR